MKTDRKSTFCTALFVSNLKYVSVYKFTWISSRVRVQWGLAQTYARLIRWRVWTTMDTNHLHPYLKVKVAINRVRLSTVDNMYSCSYLIDRLSWQVIVQLVGVWLALGKVGRSNSNNNGLNSNPTHELIGSLSTWSQPEKRFSRSTLNNKVRFVTGGGLPHMDMLRTSAGLEVFTSDTNYGCSGPAPTCARPIYINK